MKVILLSSSLALLFTGCATTSGFRSDAAPEVLVVTENSVSHLEGPPSTITLVRDQTETWSTMVDALLARASRRGVRYLADLRVSWFEIREGQTLHCEAPIAPRLILPGQDPDGLKAYQHQRTAGTDPMRGGTSPSPEARKAIESQPERSPRLEQPPTDAHPDSLAFVTDPEWTLAIEPPSCNPIEAAPSDRVTLAALAY